MLLSSLSHAKWFASLSNRLLPAQSGSLSALAFQPTLSHYVLEYLSITTLDLVFSPSMGSLPGCLPVRLSTYLPNLGSSLMALLLAQVPSVSTQTA